MVLVLPQVRTLGAELAAVQRTAASLKEAVDKKGAEIRCVYRMSLLFELIVSRFTVVQTQRVQPGAVLVPRVFTAGRGCTWAINKRTPPTTTTHPGSCTSCCALTLLSIYSPTLYMAMARQVQHCWLRSGR